MMSSYQSYTIALSIVVMVSAAYSPPVLAQDPIGACCHEGVLPTEAASKGMLEVFCEEVSEILCVENNANPQWFGAGSTCGAGPFATVQECADGVIQLPVELTGFNAFVGTDEVVLSWTTASETNNAGFSVEREVGLDAFAEIGFVEGHGTTDEPQSYRLSVAALDPGLHRFRLKQIDFDGAFEYSPIVEAAVTVPDKFLIESAYPNPFNPSTTLRFAVAVEQQVEVRLINSAGQSVRILYTGTVAANEMKTLTINANALASGTYLVQFRSDNGLESTETIVLAK